MSFDLSCDAHRRSVKSKRLYLVFSHYKNVSAVRTPYLPPETNMSRTHSVPALIQVGHQFMCSVQSHRARSSASPSPNPDYVLSRRSLGFICVAQCPDAISLHRVQLAQVVLLLIIVKSWCVARFPTYCGASCLDWCARECTLYCCHLDCDQCKVHCCHRYFDQCTLH
jgi:hypothetical protein